MHTSLSHPLQIASIKAGAGLGSVSLSFCPGKVQPVAMTGAWHRDLGIDLDAVAATGVAAVVTLVEPHELHELGVPHMGAEVERRHMIWRHLPIPDVTAPGPAFEAEWREHGPALRSLLRCGFDVFVHCKGGLGRAGTIAARLLVELGWPAAGAVAAVRRVRPGALETSAQVAHVLELPPPDSVPDASPAGVEDRALGAFLGLAVGDAIGTTLEFTRRDESPRQTDMVGGGPFNLQPGEWTDDTAMAVALATSLVACGGLDEADLMRRFVGWWRTGTYSCTGTCFDIGIATRAALARFDATGDPRAGSDDPSSAGNGSLMRLAPAVLYGFGSDRAAGLDVAVRQSAVTHAAPQCLAACERFAFILSLAIAGKARDLVLAPQAGAPDPVIDAIAAGSWRGKRRHEIASSGYVAHTLEAALWCVARTGSFAEAVLLAANLGDDADTVAAVTGQLAGALYGREGIPEDWLARLAWRDRIESLARRLIAPAR